MHQRFGFDKLGGRKRAWILRFEAGAEPPPQIAKENIFLVSVTEDGFHTVRQDLRAAVNDSPVLHD
jgi:hypothetical protein